MVPILLFTTLIVVCKAGVLLVSESGTDAGDCTAAACRSVAHALQSPAFQAGATTVELAAPGSYAPFTVNADVELVATGAGRALIACGAGGASGIVASASLSLAGVAVRGCSATGLLVDAASAVVSLENCRFADNVGEGSGGVHVKAAQSLVVRDSQFENNTATLSRGGGMNLAEITGSIQIERCQFTGNIQQQSTNDGGGALWFVNTGPTAIVNSTFTRNKASNGGAINVRQCDGDLVIERCTFEDNEAVRSEGGAVSFGEGRQNLFVRQSTFRRNWATRGSAISHRSVFTSHRLGVEDSVFAEHQYRYSVVSAGQAVLLRSNFTDNWSTWSLVNENGVLSANSAEAVDLHFVNNTALSSTAAVSFPRGDLGPASSFTSCVFTGNRGRFIVNARTVNGPVSASFHSCTFADNNGTTMALADGSFTLDQCTFDCNHGDADLEPDLLVRYPADVDVVVTNSPTLTAFACRATGPSRSLVLNGVAYPCGSDVPSLADKSCGSPAETVSSAPTYTFRPHVWIDAGATDARDCGDQAKPCLNVDYALGLAGTTIATELHLLNGRFIRDFTVPDTRIGLTVHGLGGSASVINGADVLAPNVTFTGVEFSAKVSVGEPGIRFVDSTFRDAVLSLSGFSGDVTLENVDMIELSYQNRRGIEVNYEDIHLKWLGGTVRDIYAGLIDFTGGTQQPDCSVTLDNLSVFNVGLYDGVGFVASIRSCATTITNSRFSNSRSTFLWMQARDGGSLTVRNCTFDSLLNRPMYLDGSSVYNASFIDCRFTNITGGSDGAVMVFGSVTNCQLHVDRCVFENNRCHADASSGCVGVIDAGSSSSQASVTVHRSLFRNNTGGPQGGASVLQGGNLRVYDSSFVGNRGGFGPAVVCSSGQQCTAVRCNFTGNEGGGLSLSSAPDTVTDLRFIGNGAPALRFQSAPRLGAEVSRLHFASNSGPAMKFWGGAYYPVTFTDVSFYCNENPAGAGAPDDFELEVFAQMELSFVGVQPAVPSVACTTGKGTEIIKLNGQPYNCTRPAHNSVCGPTPMPPPTVPGASSPTPAGGEGSSPSGGTTEEQPLQSGAVATQLLMTVRLVIIIIIFLV